MVDILKERSLIELIPAAKKNARPAISNYFVGAVGLTKSGKIFFGGNLGLFFGTVTDIEISPLVGYKIYKGLSAGGGFTYIYYRERYADNAVFETNQYGWRVFAMYDIFKKEFSGLKF